MNTNPHNLVIARFSLLQGTKQTQYRKQLIN